MKTSHRKNAYLIAPAASLVLLSLAASAATTNRPSATADAGPIVPQEYEITVPVKVAKVDPKFVSGRVRCEINGVFEDAKGYPIPGTSFSSDSESFALKNGGFEGKVPVRVVVTAHIKRAPTYFCSVHLNFADGQDSTTCTSASESTKGTPSAPRATCKPQPWTTFDSKTLVLSVLGNLPMPKR
jgi:hypothetical protein